MTEKRKHSHTEKPVEPQPKPEEQAAVGIPLEEHEALQKSFEEAQAKAKEYFDGWQRERADFNNYKRRVERDNQTLTQNITGELIKKYLVVQDDLERAMKLRPPELEGTPWANGIELVQRKFQNILDQEGIKRIPAEAEEFNPNRHEAITYEDSPEHGSGQIIGVVQEGYTLGERVLRPARVRVAR
jgi:molecular chaperone GrpE